MKAIVVTDQAAGMAGATLVERPESQSAINDVVVQIHAAGFTGDELTWPSTWTDRAGRDRTPSIPGHELAGAVTAGGYSRERSEECRSGPALVAGHDGLASLAGGTPGDAECSKRQPAVAACGNGTDQGNVSKPCALSWSERWIEIKSVKICTRTPHLDPPREVESR